MSAPSDPPRGVIPIADGFWNLRGSFKIAGLLDIGTHASLVRRSSGRFLLLDACPLRPEVEAWLLEVTEGGAAIDAVLHLHPFHTISVPSMHARLPRARLFGTARHRQKAADLPWEALTTDDPELHAQFADDLEFTVPRGVALIPANEHLHFGSVLAIHRASRTIHVDDTFNYFRFPKLMRPIKADLFSFHPTLARVLEPRAGAAAAFRGWAQELIERARGLDNLCAAHGAAYIPSAHGGRSLAARIEAALRKVEPTLTRHAARYG